MTELYIKNMVCQRCMQVVEELIGKLGLQALEIHMGLVKLAQSPDPNTLADLACNLRQHGFELLDSTRMRIIERLKNIIIQKIHHADNLDIKVNWSILLSNELNQDYNSLSTLFSSVEGITLEQYIIRQKIERVKELLFYDELNLSEISYKLGYSSVQHLSTQFKKITGQTPSKFKLSREIEKVRKPLDSIL
ncbi:MAG TPA: AraC family transcriptional regulator [Daejeonella sp.]|nr:AraC family transcriptional regulator [Daejeonella sp.]